MDELAMGFIALPLTTSPWLIGHPMSTVTHMISIVVNDQLKIFKIFDTLCLPLLPYMMLAKKVCQMRNTFKKVKKQVWISSGRGAHRCHHARTKSILF